MVVQFVAPADEAARIDRIDDTIGSWYLAGYNGEFGDGDRGRFHYVTDPEPTGTSAVAYTVDLGRAELRAVSDLLRRLAVLHERHPIRRVLLGEGRLPEVSR
jgi:hypothetical protein